MMAQPGQDAKFFQRGKIEVMIILVICELFSTWLPGIPRRTSDTRLEGQEVRKAQDGLKEDCR